MSTVLALVASAQDLATVQAAFPAEADVGVVGTAGGAVGLFSGGATLADDLRALPQVAAAADEATLAGLGAALDVLTVDPARSADVVSTLFGPGVAAALQADVLTTLAGVLLGFSPAARAMRQAAPATSEETGGSCVRRRFTE
jgi:hypothetical protein